MTDLGLLELPAVRTPPIAELAEGARECQRLRLVRRLGLPGDQGPGVVKARSAADFTELDELWHSAVELELPSTHRGRATPSPALADLAR